MNGSTVHIPKNSNLGIIAGKGALPSLVMRESLKLELQPVIVCFKDNNVSIDLSNVPYLETTLGKIGQILEFFKSKNVEYLIFAGSVPRPSFSLLSFDATGVKWMQKLGLKAFGGDDALLSGICELLTQEDFKIISTKDFLPNLVLKQGIYTNTKPSAQDLLDIKRGSETLELLSSADIGQSCIVQEGIVLGIEAIEGTAELMQRCVNLKRNPKGGTLIKLAKKGQSELVDLPTIGIDTIKSLHNGNYAGIAVSANTTQILQFDEVIKLCNEYKLFLQAV
jgi:DUF1009 family protein